MTLEEEIKHKYNILNEALIENVRRILRLHATSDAGKIYALEHSLSQYDKFINNITHKPTKSSKITP